MSRRAGRQLFCSELRDHTAAVFKHIRIENNAKLLCTRRYRHARSIMQKDRTAAHSGPLTWHPFLLSLLHTAVCRI